MKFKSEEENIENEEPKNEQCPLCDILNVMDKQVDILFSMISSIKTSLDTIHKLHEEHDSK